VDASSALHSQSAAAAAVATTTGVVDSGGAGVPAGLHDRVAEKGGGAGKGKEGGEAGERLFSTRGVAIATCCHHRCSWRAYVNKPFMRRLGFDRESFGFLARMSSWACDGAFDDIATPAAAAAAAATTAAALAEIGSLSPAAKRARVDAPASSGEPSEDLERGYRRGYTTSKQSEDEEEAAFGEMTKHEKAVVGRMVKTLLDTGRLAWLKVTPKPATLITKSQIQTSNLTRLTLHPKPSP